MAQNILDVSIVRDVSNVLNIRILPEQPLIAELSPGISSKQTSLGAGLASLKNSVESQHDGNGIMCVRSWKICKRDLQNYINYIPKKKKYCSSF